MLDTDNSKRIRKALDANLPGVSSIMQGCFSLQSFLSPALLPPCMAVFIKYLSTLMSQDIMTTHMNADCLVTTAHVNVWYMLEGRQVFGFRSRHIE